MHPSALRGHRGRRAARWTAGLLLVFGVGLAVASCGGPRYERRGPLHCVVEGRHLYTFDPVWRTEEIHRIDPATGLPLDEAEGPLAGREAERYRRVLLRELGVASLDSIPPEGEAELKALRALGYL